MGDSLLMVEEYQAGKMEHWHIEFIWINEEKPFSYPCKMYY